MTDAAPEWPAMSASQVEPAADARLEETGTIDMPEEPAICTSAGAAAYSGASCG